jgi:hypothetical protein
VSLGNPVYIATEVKRKIGHVKTVLENDNIPEIEEILTGTKNSLNQI